MRNKLTTWGLVLALSATVALTACRKRQAASPPPTEVQGNPITENIGRAPAQGDIRRGAERQVDQNMLREIAKYYRMYSDETGRPPRSLEEFLPYMKDAPGQFQRALKDEWIVMVWNAPLNSNTVIAYEKNVYQKWNNLLVAFGDGHVVLMQEPDFQAALKASKQ